MRLLMLVGGLMVANVSFAVTETTTCTNGKTTRRVELQNEGQTPTSGPCKVVYYKDTEASGAAQDLWTAKTDGSFCQQKRDGFVQKLSGLGWTCNAGATGTTTAAAEKTSTTEPTKTETTTTTTPETATTPNTTPETTTPSTQPAK